MKNVMIIIRLILSALFLPVILVLFFLAMGWFWVTFLPWLIATTHDKLFGTKYQDKVEKVILFWEKD